METHILPSELSELAHALCTDTHKQFVDLA